MRRPNIRIANVVILAAAIGSIPPAAYGDDRQIFDDLRHRADAAKKAKNWDEEVRLVQQMLPLVDGAYPNVKARGFMRLALAYELRAIAFRCTALQRFREAVSAAKQAQAILDLVEDVDEKTVAGGHFLLGFIYHQWGRHRDAAACAERALGIYERVLGQDYVAKNGDIQDIPHCLWILAGAYLGLGHYAQAESLQKRALEMQEKELGADHISLADGLLQLGSIYQTREQFPLAEACYERTVRIREAHLDIEGAKTDLGGSLNNLANLYRTMGAYSKAETFYERSLKLYESGFGSEAPAVALVLTNWGALYREMGQWSRAEPLYLRSLQIAEARLGEDSSQVAWHLECLANCYRDMGLYAKAEPLYQRSLRIRKEQLGQDHPTVGECLRELGEFYRTLGQYAKAEPLYQSSLRILEASLGKEHRSVAGSLQGLASLYTDMGQYTGAEPLLQRGLQIYEARLGKDHADVGRVRNTLARLYQRMGRFQDAEAQFKHGLQILEARFGKDHPEVAAAVHNLAELYKDTGRYAEAEPLAQQALDVRRARLGKEHPATVASQQLLATLRLLDGRHAEAVRLTHLALQSQRAHQVRVLPALAESDQLTYLQQAGSLDEPLSLALAGPLTDDTATRTAGWLINGKVVAQQAVAERMLLAREARSEEAKKQLQELTDVRQELARLTLDPTRRDPAEARKRKEELTEKERLLSTQLHQHDERSWRDEPWVELDELTRRLPSGSAYVDFARFRVRDFRAADKSKQWKPARYAAWVTTPRGEVHVVDLGEADVLDAAVRDARQTLDQSPRLITKAGSEVAAEQQAHATLARLADRLLKPLRPYLDAAPRWLICPDGNLWLVPWAALPLDGKTYAVENHTIALVVSGRDLVIDPLRLDLKAGPPLVVADPDFDHRPSATAPAVRLAGLSCRGKIGQRPVIFEFAKEGNLNIYEGDQTRERIGEGSWSLSGRELSMQTRISRFTGQLSAGRVSGEREKRDEDGQIIRDRWEFRLPAETVAQLGQTRGLPSQKLQKVPRLPGTAAEGEAVAEQLRKLFGARPTMLTAQGASTAAVRAVRSPRALVLATHGYFLPDSAAVAKNRNSAPGRLENPLLRCGLLLAGCNHAAEAEEGEDSGVLTGLDVVGLDLRGTELVVLSACETGLGEVRNTEGVAGLRQAFQLAGAQSVLASLWHVPDDDTALLMSSYFSRLASGEGRAEALRQAQLQRIKERRDKFGAAHPYFWAAFSLTGDASPLGVR